MKNRMFGALALGAAAALALAGCSGDTGGKGGAEPSKTITVGYVSGWTDGQSMAYLYKQQFEKMGYKVEIEEMADNGPLYAGVAKGDIDVFASAVPEVMQNDYWKKYGDDMEDINVWNGAMQNILAVPSYSKITSIEDLKGNADLFDGEIIGIEPGAGLTQMTEDRLMPKYGLESEYKLVTSSTAAMLTALTNAIDKKQEIVVTLWRPFWAYTQLDVRALEDPLGGMADPEGMHTLARSGFAEDYPELADYLKSVKISNDDYGDLETLIVDKQYKSDSIGAVEAWLKEHPDAYSGIVK